MIPTIKLTDGPKTIDLLPAKYNIYIVGGHNVELNSFRISIVDKSTNEYIPIKEYNLKVRDFNAVRYFYFDITKIESYEITFHNYDSLMIKKSMLPILRFFHSSINSSDIRIRIERN